MLGDDSDDSGMTWVGQDRANRGGFGHGRDRVHYTILFIHFRYANLHYPSYLRITRRVGVLKELLYH